MIPISWYKLLVGYVYLLHGNHGRRLSSVLPRPASDRRKDLASMLFAMSPVQTLPGRGRHFSTNGVNFQSPPVRSASEPVVRRSSSVVMKDLYGVLGVDRGASQRDIKTAFKKAARKCHPDVNPSEEAKKQFAEIAEAQEVLTDDSKRRMYDQFGYEAVKRGGGGAGGYPGGAGFEDFDLGDIFDSFFSGGGGRGGRRRDGPIQGDDLRFDLELDFKTAAFGGAKKIRITHLETCGTCKGSGVAPGAKITTCAACNGRGVQVQVMNTILGRVQQQVPCGACGGTGQQVEKYCGTCDGKGVKNVGKEVTINIPCGVNDGNRLRIRGEGDAGMKGGPAGDLYVFISVARHPEFRRDDNKILSSLDISYIDAILGCTREINTIDGKYDIKVPPGTQSGTVLRIDGKGAPVLNQPNKRGPHLVTVKVSIPKSVSDKEKKLLKELREVR